MTDILTTLLELREDRVRFGDNYSVRTLDAAAAEIKELRAAICEGFTRHEATDGGQWVSSRNIFSNDTLATILRILKQQEQSNEH